MLILPGYNPETTSFTHDSKACLERNAYGFAIGGRVCRDPLANAEMRQGANLYGYCKNNTINLVDTNGEEVIGAVIGAVIGGVVGGIVTHSWAGAFGGVVGGAVAGLTFNPALGMMAASGITGSFAAAGAGAISGALGAGAGNLTKQTINMASGNQSNFNGSEFGYSVAGGAVMGGLFLVH